MPRYRVTEIRARRSVYLIDAETEEDARSGNGDIIDEGADADDYTDEVLEVEQVDDDVDVA